MTERNVVDEAGTRLCRFPGCGRPAEEGDGRGRPPSYCDDPAHTRAAAYRARQQTAGDGVELGAEEPITFARARAGLLVERVEAAVVALSMMTTEVVAELRTLGDVEAVEVELESVSASADQRAAEARAVAAEAETRRRRAEANAVEAEQLRDEAEAAAEEALAAEARSREAARAAEQIAADAQDEAARLTIEASELIKERDVARDEARSLSDALTAAQAEVERLQGELDLSREVLADQTAIATVQLERADSEAARADQAESVIADLRSTLNVREQTVATLQEQLIEQRTSLAQSQGRLEEATAQREQLREQVSARDERIHELEDEHAVALTELAAITSQLKTEQAAAATAAAVAERSAAARVADVRDLYEARLADLQKGGAPE